MLLYCLKKNPTIANRQKSNKKKPQIIPKPRNPHEIVIICTTFSCLKIFHYSNLKFDHLCIQVLSDILILAASFCLSKES